MIGVVIPIEGQAAERLREIWAALAGVVGHPPHDVLHVSLHVAAEYDREHVDLALRSLARSQSPFSVYVAGFGVFSGAQPLLHLVVSRSPRLTVLHRVMAQELGRFGTDTDANFSAERWVPHITLGRSALSADAISAAARTLAERPLAFPLPVEDLAILEDTAEGQRVLARYRLGV